MCATSGTAAGEGHLEVHNLDLPGMPELDGSRTYRAAEGSATVAAQAGSSTPTGPRADELTFPRGRFRHLRMLGARPDPSYGYSLYAFEIRDSAAGADLARGAGATASASSFDPGKEPALAVDGDGSTRWAISRADRPRADSWLAVDLGAALDVDRVTLRWETAAGRAYRMQGSVDGQNWTDLVAWPQADLTSRGGWLDIDGRAGLVVRGGANPISVYGNTVVLSDGPAEGILVAQIATGFGISVGTAHAYTTAVVGLLADRSPGLLRALREADPDYVLLDGTLAECDRVGDGRADFSHKHRRHGVNV